MTNSNEIGLDALDELLSERRLIVVAGSGGVGKTTTAAALGVRAAQMHGRRVTVVTVDPARRLADALGVARVFEEPVLVPVGGAAQGSSGRLWVVMVDMAKSWDRLVDNCAPTPLDADRLQENGLYQSLTRRFVQSHDYVALDQILRLEERGQSELLIVDTPPSTHALDLIDAPGRLLEFFDSRLLRLLTDDRAGLSQMAARPFYVVARRLLGESFLSDIVEFFTLFAKLRPAMVERIEELTQRLDDPSTVTLAVSNLEPASVETTEALLERLAERGRKPEVVIVNRVPPPLTVTYSPDGKAELSLESDDFDFDLLDDESLRAGVEWLVDRAKATSLPRSEGSTVLGIALQSAEPVDVDALAQLLGSSAQAPG